MAALSYLAWRGAVFFAVSWQCAQGARNDQVVPLGRLAPSLMDMSRYHNGLSGDFGRCPEDNFVCVAIRIRPVELHETVVVEADMQKQVMVDRNTFRFDLVFPPKHDEAPTTNKDVYESIVAPSIEKAFACNKDASCNIGGVTFLAYGGTGSGKSYTMGFESKARERGLLQLGMDQVFRRLESRQRVWMVMYEVYGKSRSQTAVFDLLLAKRDRNGMMARRKEKLLSTLTHELVTSIDDINRLFAHGIANRVVRDNGYHGKSSRSHAIVEFFVTQEDSFEQAISSAGKSVHLIWADLAGSELPPDKNKDLAGHVEGTIINQGLGELLQCLQKAGGRNKMCHPSNNMLTLMLKDLFVENNAKPTLTRYISCVNPSEDVRDLSVRTLKRAYEVKELKILPFVVPAKTVKEDKTDAVRKQEQIEIAELQSQLQEATGQVSKLQVYLTQATASYEALQEKAGQQAARLKQQVENAGERATQLEQQVAQSKVAHHAQATQLQQQVAQSQASHHKALKELSSARAEFKSVQKELEEQQIIVGMQKGQLEEMKEQLDYAVQANDDLGSTIEQHKIQLEATREQLVYAEEQIAEKQKEEDLMKGRLETLQLQLKDVLRINEEQQAQMDDMRRQLDGAEQERDALQSKVKQQETDLDTAQRQLNETQAQVDKLETQKQKKQGQIDKLREEKKNAVPKEDLKGLELERDELASRQRLLNLKVRRLGRELGRVKEELAETQEELVATQEQNKRLQGQVAELRRGMQEQLEETHLERQKQKEEQKVTACSVAYYSLLSRADIAGGNAARFADIVEEFETELWMFNALQLKPPQELVMVDNSRLGTRLNDFLDSLVEFSPEAAQEAKVAKANGLSAEKFTTLLEPQLDESWTNTRSGVATTMTSIAEKYELNSKRLPTASTDLGFALSVQLEGAAKLIRNLVAAAENYQMMEGAWRSLQDAVDRGFCTTASMMFKKAGASCEGVAVSKTVVIHEADLDELLVGCGGK